MTIPLVAACGWCAELVGAPDRLQQESPKGFKTPSAPPLSAADEIRTFKIAPGYRAELVAAEPLVHDPVAMTFDPDGRLWVCEMRGFMPNVDGKGEKEPIGTVSVLEDTRGTGVMDKSTLFLNNLVLPRAVCWTTDGLVVAANGKIWLCAIGADLKCRDRKVICEYNPGNPEYALNGLMPALDNWIYSAKEGIRLRKLDGRWVREATLARGQWGITQDNHGYLIYNVNAQLIRGDLVPCYSPNAHVANPMTNVQLYKTQDVWPIRPNPGINRGYMASFLRPDGTMIEANANCGPVVYRGDNLPRELVGDVFISDPAGNLVRRQVMVTDKGVKSSKNAYDKREFLASTDERFRPVNMNNAPDGTLYLVDMYRGIIQHGAFMTPYLRKEIIDRNLDKPIGLGRIFRIVHETTQQRKPVALGKASSSELVSLLSHANGWHRDMAQQLLVQRKDLSVVADLKKLATTGAESLGRLHALWTLEGLDKLNVDFLLGLLADKDSGVRASAVFLGRSAISRNPEPGYVQELGALADDPDPIVRMQVALTLGQVGTSLADRTLEPILQRAAADPKLLEALLAGYAGQESEFLAARIMLPAWARPEPWRQKLLTTAAGILWQQRQPLAVLRFLHLVSGQHDEQAWQQIALLEGLKSAPGKAGKAAKNQPRVVTLPAVPEGLERLRKSSNRALAGAAENLAKQLIWPGKDGKPLPVPAPLSARHQALHDLGMKEYMALCASCHHPAGYGDAGKGPPLIDSDWLDLSEDRLVRLVLFGLRGPITVNGDTFNKEGALEMPGMYAALDDEKIAGVLTYVRRQWREKAQPIEPETVTRIRKLTNGRTDQWTQKELFEIVLQDKSVLAPGAKLEKLSGEFKFTEGPACDADGNVLFTDQPNDRIMKWSTEGKLSTFLKPSGRSNGLCFDSKGNLWSCADEKNELWIIDPKGKIAVVVKDYQGKLLNGPNDVWVRPDGGVYITDPYYKRDYWKRGPKEQDKEAVYYLTPDHKTLTRVADDMQQPNGIIGTSDGKLLYVADIRGNKTYAYDVQDDGTLKNKRLFCSLGSDGMTIDNEGNVYLTGQGVTIFDMTGKQIEKIAVPEPWTANVCFGGKERDTLFITASKCLYSVKMRVKGVGSQ
jgi:sugar lactone lactonase YvrE/mono/diheme cytochrome c family protein